MKKLAVYLRTSTDKQDKGFQSQKHAITKWCKNHGYKKSQVVFYEDIGVSGENMDRPAFNKLQSAIFQGEHDIVVTWALDRVGRKFLESCTIIRKWLDDGIRLVTISCEQDWSGKEGRLVAGIFLLVAEMQLAQLKENTKRGIERARAEGKQIGGSKKGVPKKVTSDKVDTILTLKQQGKSIKAIAQVVGLHRETVSKVLKQVA